MERSCIGPKSYISLSRKKCKSKEDEDTSDNEVSASRYSPTSLKSGGNASTLSYFMEDGIGDPIPNNQPEEASRANQTYGEPSISKYLVT
jgi:hypothetical protein